MPIAIMIHENITEVNRTQQEIMLCGMPTNKYAPALVWYIDKFMHLENAKLFFLE